MPDQNIDLLHSIDGIMFDYRTGDRTAEQAADAVNEMMVDWDMNQ